MIKETNKESNQTVVGNATSEKVAPVKAAPDYNQKTVEEMLGITDPT